MWNDHSLGVAVDPFPVLRRLVIIRGVCVGFSPPPAHTGKSLGAAGRKSSCWGYTRRRGALFRTQSLPGRRARVSHPSPQEPYGAHNDKVVSFTGNFSRYCLLHCTITLRTGHMSRYCVCDNVIPLLTDHVSRHCVCGNVI